MHQEGQPRQVMLLVAIPIERTPLLIMVLTNLQLKIQDLPVDQILAEGKAQKMAQAIPTQDLLQLDRETALVHRQIAEVQMKVEALEAAILAQIRTLQDQTAVTAILKGRAIRVQDQIQVIDLLAHQLEKVIQAQRAVTHHLDLAGLLEAAEPLALAEVRVREVQEVRVQALEVAQAQEAVQVLEVVQEDLEDRSI